MSGQIQIHMEQAEQELHDHAAALEIINRVNLSLARELDLEKLIQSLIVTGTQVSGAEFGAFLYHEVSPNGEDDMLYTLSGGSTQALEKFPVRQNTPLFEQILRDQEVVRSEDITRDPRYDKNSPHSGIHKTNLPVRSFLAVPVVSFSGKVHGGLFFGHSKAGIFGALVEKIIVGIAAQAAVSIDNAQTFAQLHRNDERLRESEERFARFMQQLPGLAWIKDVKGRYVYANNAAEKAFRTPREKLYGRTDQEIFPPEIAAQFTENDRQALASETGIQVIETLEHEDGVLHHSIVSKFPILGPDGQPALIGGIAIDITARKQAEAERERLLAELDKERARLKELAETLEERVLHRTAQVRDLASALALAEERERFRISQVLHDDLQQLIYSQLMRLELLQKKLSGDQKEMVDDLFTGMKEQMTQAIHVTRALAAELTPPEEAVENLGKGLEWLVRHMQEAHGLNVTLKCNGLYDIHCGEMQGLLLQIVRELLFNVVKHAGTNQALLEVNKKDDFLEISVQDNGVGFDTQTIQTRSERKAGFGLLSIADRLRLLGGRLEIESAPAAGTRMTICAPVEA